MPHKFRIRLYPTDASRIREISISRKLGWLVVICLVPLSILGFWLVFSSSIKEENNQKLLRYKLAEENSALKKEVRNLSKDLQQMQTDVSALEEQKVNAMILTGMEYMQTENKKKGRSLFSFFQSTPSNQTDVAALLVKARNMSKALDSSLELLHNNPEWVRHLPTSPLLESQAIIIRGFGYSPDPFTGKKNFHAGVDFADKPGTPVYAPGEGTVTAVARDNIWGLYVQIDHGRQVETFYAHLQEAKVTVGQHVMRGDKVATLGSSGVTTGPHLHYELSLLREKTDPLIYFLPKLHAQEEARAKAEEKASI
jgi:murein DD-endopeptidase MepM/ murein hydrolase activator NlpD